MVFSSIEFLFYFLPATLIGYYVLKRWRRAANIFLSVMSLGFYAFGAPKFFPIMMASIAMNWLFGLWVDRVREDRPKAKLAIALMVVFNLGLLGVFVLAGIVFSICMGAAMADKPKEEQPVVILGCKVRGDRPSLMLKKRLDAAIPYLKEHPELPVIVCGGQGADESMTEAACMADYLRKNGIDADRIFEDAASTSTYENLSNARHILEENDWGYDIILVTDGYHQFRAGEIAKGLRLSTDKISAPTSWYLIPVYWLREWLGIAHMYIFG